MIEQNNDNLPDDVAAISAWKDYSKNNNSIVVDLFQVLYLRQRSNQAIYFSFSLASFNSHMK